MTDLATQKSLGLNDASIEFTTSSSIVLQLRRIRDNPFQSTQVPRECSEPFKVARHSDDDGSCLFVLWKPLRGSAQHTPCCLGGFLVRGDQEMNDTVCIAGRRQVPRDYRVVSVSNLKESKRPLVEQLSACNDRP